MIRTRTLRIVRLAAALCVVALLLAAVAVAASRGYKGKFEGGGKVNFKAKIKDGKPVQVLGSTKPLPFGSGFSWSKVPVRCSQGVADITGHANFAMKVKKGKFGATRSAGANSTRIRGKFSDKNHAKGTLRFTGNLFHEGELWNGCDTGAVKWNAKH